MEITIILVYRIAQDLCYSGFWVHMNLEWMRLITNSMNDSKFVSNWGFKGYCYFLVMKGYWVEIENYVINRETICFVLGFY